MTFLDLLRHQIADARAAAAAHARDGRAELADWWRWRADDLQRYLDDGSLDAHGSAA
jgi:hypothetical protein